MSVRGISTLLCVGTLAAGCSTAMPTAVLPSAAAGQSVAPTTNGTHRGEGKLVLRIRVPHDVEGRTHYISPGTKGLSIALRGTATETLAFALTPHSPGCSQESGATLCSVVVPLAAGKYRANVATYDAAPVGGSIPGSANVLSSTSDVPLHVKTGKANSFRVTLAGVPASFTIVPPSATAGTAFATPKQVGVQVKDADGYLIVGRYVNAVALKDSDTSGATVIATSGSDNPPSGELLSSSDTATLSYNGLAIAPVALQASAPRAALGTAQFTPALHPILLMTSDTLNPSYAGVDLYATSGTGSSQQFTASEVGWTNSPYDRTFQTSPGSGCTSIATVSTFGNGNQFTATVVASPTASTCSYTLNDGAGQSKIVTLAYTFFAYTGASQAITVPAGVTQTTILAAGGQGQGGDGYVGGNGGLVSAVVPVSAGQSLAVYVGGSGTAGGFNGGGVGAAQGGGSGGGASDVRQLGTGLNDRIAVGGGGGGAGYLGGYTGESGASGGSLIGGSASGELGGGGGTQSNGGTGGSYDSRNPDCAGGGNGSLGLGGFAGGCPNGGGGGGGGYYGGGGGGGSGPAYGGGGGGSSYAENDATSVVYSQGAQSGNGKVTLIW